MVAITHWELLWGICYQKAVSGPGFGQVVLDMKTRPEGIGKVNADWMGSLPSQLSAMPLKHIAVPGEPCAERYVQLKTIRNKCV